MQSASGKGDGPASFRQKAVRLGLCAKERSQDQIPCGLCSLQRAVCRTEQPAGKGGYKKGKPPDYSEGLCASI